MGGIYFDQSLREREINPILKLYAFISELWGVTAPPRG